MAVQKSRIRSSQGRASALVALCVVLAGIVVSTAPSVLAAGPSARIAREQSVTDRTYFRLVGSPGVEITEKGTSYGTFPGSVLSHLKFSGGHISGTFVLHTHGDIVRGSTNGSVVGKSAQPVVTFAGTVSITSGTGSYAHARGLLKLKGSIRRSNYEIYEETSGRVHL